MANCLPGFLRLPSVKTFGVGGGEAGVSGVYLSVSVWLAGGTVSVCATVATSQGGWAPHRWAGVSTGNGRSSKACWAVSLASQPVRGAPPSAIVRRSGTYRASILEYILYALELATIHVYPAAVPT